MIIEHEDDDIGYIEATGAIVYKDIKNIKHILLEDNNGLIYKIKKKKDFIVAYNKPIYGNPNDVVIDIMLRFDTIPNLNGNLKTNAEVSKINRERLLNLYNEVILHNKNIKSVTSKTGNNFNGSYPVIKELSTGTYIEITKVFEILSHTEVISIKKDRYRHNEKYICINIENKNNELRLIKIINSIPVVTTEIIGEVINNEVMLYNNDLKDVEINEIPISDITDLVGLF